MILQAAAIAKDIDNWCIKHLHDGRRKHLGASEIGDPCSRKLWYKFRWCGVELMPDVSHVDAKIREQTARMLRLFSRGHKEEPFFIQYLRGIGATVYDVDDKGDQFGFSACGGHFGGHCDGVALLPAKYGIEKPLLTEYKTQGTGKSFTDLCAKGVKLVKPMHYAQMCVYGVYLKLQQAIYMVVNKNDDSLHIELVNLDYEFGNELGLKAEKIVSAHTPPAKVSESPAFFSCKYCEFNELCHYEGKAVKNCRSCVSCVPIDSAQWVCNLHGSAIPEDFIPTGCDHWKSITE